MKLKSIAITKADREKREKAWSEPKAEMPEYPYGMRIQLDHETLKKLGIDELPAVGSYLALEARVCVRETAENDDIYNGGDKRRSMTVQIEKMALESAGDEEDEE